MDAAKKITPIRLGRHELRAAPERVLVIVVIQVPEYSFNWVGIIWKEIIMRSIKACLLAVFAAILLIGSPAAATDVCDTGQPMCRVQAEPSFKLAADYSVKPKGPAGLSAKCGGLSGTDLAKCKCEAKGEPGFPCHFRAGPPPRCLCR
jgi:hypothetical protein